MLMHSLQEKHRKRAAAVSLAAVFGATPFVVAMTVDTAVAAPPARMKGTITAAGGAALGGIRVSALSLMPIDGVNQWVEVDAAVSGVDGSFNVGKLPDGADRLRYYDPTGTFATEFYDNAPRADVANDILLSGTNTSRSGLDAELGGAAHLTGKVTDNLGAALAGVDVTTYVLQGADWVPYQSVESAADGSYDLGGLPAGDYTLGFSDPASGAAEYWNDEAAIADADRLAVSSSGTTTGLNASLDTGATQPPEPTPTVTETATATATATATETAATVTSTATTTTTAAPTEVTIRVVKKPRIKGVRMVGSKLRVTKGAFSPSLVKRKIQWLANGKAVKGATKKRLLLRPKLQGKRISVKVTVKAPGAKPLVVKCGRTKRIRPAS